MFFSFSSCCLLKASLISNWSIQHIEDNTMNNKMQIYSNTITAEETLLIK